MFGLGRRRDARLAEVWDEALERGGRRSPLHVRPYTRCECLGQVVGHRQRARTGTKAWVRWVADDQTTAAWFWKARPAVGTYVLATGEYGHGTHHPEDVFYVAPGDYRVIPVRSLRAWSRHQRRLGRDR
jgi:hypothetical protein